MIGDEGAKALAVALTPNAEGVFNTSLNTLNLRGKSFLTCSCMFLVIFVMDVQEVRLHQVLVVQITTSDLKEPRRWPLHSLQMQRECSTRP